MIKVFTHLQIIPKQFIPPITDYNKSFVYVDNAQECDYLLFPYWEVITDYGDNQYKGYNLEPGLKKEIQKAVDNLISLSELLNKPAIIIYFSDSDIEIPVTNAIILRTSLYKSKQQPNVFAYPSWNGDLQHDYMNSTPNLRTKNDKPSVGFRGSAKPFGFSLENLMRSQINILNSSVGKLGYTYRSSYAWNRGQILRHFALKKLKINSRIKSDFTILTRGYIKKSEIKRENNRRLFVNNIINNDYNLCVRGAGNYSYRLYETLSAGRIPIIINTDCVLPYDFIIDWKKYCVWVEEKDVDRVDEILLDFHSQMSSTDFSDLQINIRKLWDEWISRQGFFKNFVRHFNQMQSNTDSKR